MGKKRIWECFWLPLILSVAWMGFILYESLRPAVPDVFNLIKNHPVVLPQIDGGIFMTTIRDIVGHSTFYFVWGLLLFWLSITLKLKGVRQFLLVVVFAGLFGGVVELLQEFCTLTRGAEWCDLASDFVGPLIAFFIGKLVWNCYLKRKSINNN